MKKNRNTGVLAFITGGILSLLANPIILKINDHSLPSPTFQAEKNLPFLFSNSLPNWIISHINDILENSVLLLSSESSYGCYIQKGCHTIVELFLKEIRTACLVQRLKHRNY